MPIPVSESVKAADAFAQTVAHLIFDSEDLPDRTVLVAHPMSVANDYHEGTSTVVFWMGCGLQTRYSVEGVTLQLVLTGDQRTLKWTRAACTVKFRDCPDISLVFVLDEDGEITDGTPELAKA